MHGTIWYNHTFKVAANIGLLGHSDKKWEKQYDSMFCILNGKTAFNNVKGLLKNLKGRFDQEKKNVKLCIIDNCCAWRGKLQEVFGSGMVVKLELFHAVD